VDGVRRGIVCDIGLDYALGERLDRRNISAHIYYDGNVPCRDSNFQP
jgi:hypothetical protein